MFLDKKIKASSLAEVIIAVSVIAICIGIASLVFVRSTKVTMNFQDVKRQTEIQSEIWSYLLSEKSEMNEIEEVKTEEAESINDSLLSIKYIGNYEKIIWIQDIVRK